MREARIRQGIKAGIDTVVILFGVVAAFLIKYDLSWDEYFRRTHQLVYTITFMLGYFVLKIHKKSWRQTTVVDVVYVIGLNVFAALVFFLGAVATRSTFPKHLLLLIVILCSAMQLLVRHAFKIKLYLQGKGSVESKRKRILIIGAGGAGEILVRESRKNPNFKYEIVGLVDDDPQKQNINFHGHDVLGRVEDIEEIVEEYAVEVMVLAIPSAGREMVKKMSNLSKDLEVEMRVLPSIDDILLGESLTKQIREVKIEDLLGREEVSVNTEGIHHFIEGKTIFVTGGAGSIGSELSRQIAKYNPKKLVNIDINENAIYFLELELRRKYPNLDIVSEICSVRDRDKLEWVFERYNPELVFHAAAHKHVPLMEHNPEEAIKNNIFGTKNVADNAEKYGVERFVLVSTDKAVNPTNIMGATKRACEIVIQEKAKTSKTKFMAVRFGNVLGSNGSVIPLFKKLIEEGKNLTLTHPDITRYFMTIPEAAQLVIEAGSLGKGGEVFILDMGEPIKIIDLAQNLIDLSQADVGIDIVGLRPGEKLYEELLYDVNAAVKTDNKKIFITKLKVEEIDLDYNLARLEKLITERDCGGIKAQMKSFVSTYREPDHHFDKSENIVKNKLRGCSEDKKEAQA